MSEDTASGENSSIDTEHTASDKGTAVIESFRGWVVETGDDRHSVRGGGAGYSARLYTPSHHTDLGIQSLQAATIQLSSENWGRGSNFVSPQDAHPSRLPIGRIFPVDILVAAYTDPQPSQAATSRVSSPSFSSAISSESSSSIKKDSVRTREVTLLDVATVTTADRSLQTDTEPAEGNDE